MKIKLVAFDWNGTILADLSAMVRANNAVFRHLGFPEVTVNKYRDNFQIPIKNYWVALGLDPKLFDKYVVEQEQIFAKNYEPEENKCRTRSGLKELLKFLHDYKIESVIFSNHIVPHIEKQLKRLNIDQYFTKVLGRPINTAGHNHKRFKDGMLKDFIDSNGLKPGEVMVVGDTDEEIEIGKSFGYTTIALTGGHQATKRLKVHKPDYLIHNLKELKRIISTI